MVINTRLGEWCSRLFELHRLTQQELEGPIWLWRIRIKILKYLVTRYPDEPIAKTPADDTQTRRADSVSSAPATLLDRPLPEAPRPPQSCQVVRPVLDELQVRNNQRRNDEGFYPDPEVIWEWWRETWCMRK